MNATFDFKQFGSSKTNNGDSHILKLLISLISLGPALDQTLSIFIIICIRQTP